MRTGFIQSSSTSAPRLGTSPVEVQIRAKIWITLLGREPLTWMLAGGGALILAAMLACVIPSARDPLPPEVLIQNGTAHLIRSRQTLNDLTRGEVITT